MEDFEGEEGILDGKRDMEGESLIPNGTSRARVVGFGGEFAIRIEPEDGVGL